MLAMPGRCGRDRSGFKSQRDEATGAGADLRRASSLLRVGRTSDWKEREEAESGRADTFVAVFGGQIKTNFVGCSETGVGSSRKSVKGEEKEKKRGEWGLWWWCWWRWWCVWVGGSKDGRREVLKLELSCTIPVHRMYGCWDTGRRSGRKGVRVRALGPGNLSCLLILALPGLNRSDYMLFSTGGQVGLQTRPPD